MLSLFLSLSFVEWTILTRVWPGEDAVFCGARPCSNEAGAGVGAGAEGGRRGGVQAFAARGSCGALLRYYHRTELFPKLPSSLSPRVLPPVLPHVLPPAAASTHLPPL